MGNRLLNVLLVCDSNSCLSIFGEAIVNRFGRGRFRGYSAGMQPQPEIDAMTIYQLTRNNYDTGGLQVNDWREYADSDGPAMDFVVALSEQFDPASHPEWPGDPMIAQWHIDDPAVHEGTEMARKAAFSRALTELENRISIFVNLPIGSLDRLKLQQQLNDIGRIRDDR